MTDQKKSCLFWLIVLLALAPWFFIQMNTGINGDTAWLLIAAQRLLNGMTFSQDVFETNPPLNIAIHIPIVLLAKLTGLPVYAAAYICILALIGLSFTACAHILKELKFITAEHRAFILTGFLAGATIIPSISFSERDHLIFLGLAPLVLASYARSRKIKLSKNLEYPVLVLGSIAILLKPHYAALPAALLLYRAVKQKRFFSLLKDLDIVIMLAMALVYALSLPLFAPDFLTGVLPFILKLYLSASTPEIVFPILGAHIIIIGFFLVLEGFFSAIKGDEKEFSIILYSCALLCLIPYALQMKGYEYHLIPALGFFYVALSNTIYIYTKTYIRRDFARLAISLGLIFGVAYVHKPLLPDYPTHKEYRELPLANAIEQNCLAPCTVFVFHNNMEILWQSILYTNATQASRFPAFWFLPPIYLKHNLTDEETTSLKSTFAKMIAEDLNHYQPSTLILASNLHPHPDEIFQFIKYFSDNPDFRKAIAPYKKTGEMELNQRDYFRGASQDRDEILTYDIYKR